MAKKAVSKYEERQREKLRIFMDQNKETTYTLEKNIKEVFKDSKIRRANLGAWLDGKNSMRMSTWEVLVNYALTVGVDLEEVEIPKKRLKEILK